MLKLSESEVKEIAQQVNSGRTVFIHKQTRKKVKCTKKCGKIQMTICKLKA